MTLQDIATGLRARKSGSGFMACCPAHKDKNPSLHLSEKNGKILVYCFAGCTQQEVIEQLREMNLWPRRERLPYPIYCHVRQLEQFIADMDREKEALLAQESFLAYMADFMDRDREFASEYREWTDAEFRRWIELCSAQREAREEIRKISASS